MLREDRINNLTWTLYRFTTQLRRVDPDIPLAAVHCVFWVALNEGKTQVDLRNSTGMSSSSASRNLAYLSKHHRLGKEGLGLIEWVENPADRRAKLLYLTPRGRDVIGQLTATLL